jgi:hypothetical protein
MAADLPPAAQDDSLIEISGTPVEMAIDPNFAAILKTTENVLAALTTFYTSHTDVKKATVVADAEVKKADAEAKKASYAAQTAASNREAELARTRRAEILAEIHLEAIKLGMDDLVETIKLGKDDLVFFEDDSGGNRPKAGEHMDDSKMAAKPPPTLKKPAAKPTPTKKKPAAKHSRGTRLSLK